MQIIGSIFKGIIALAMVAGVIVGGVFIYKGVGQVFPGGGPSSDKAAQPVTFTIKSGESISQIADNLQSQGIIDSAFLFKLQLKTSDKEKDIKAGDFQLTTHMDNSKVISILSAPIADAPGVKFQVIEGWRVEEIAAKLGDQGIISPTHFLDLAKTPAGSDIISDTFLTGAGRPDGAGLEGYLFPDTYEIKQEPGDQSEAVIKLMYKTLEDRVTPEMRQALAAKGRTIHQMLTVASIVQREGVVPTELPRIAAVYWNRVDDGILLNADPVNQYIVGQAPKWWPELSLDDLKVDSPYNTYTTRGLPPGPICASGLGAIRAAVYPEDSTYLYFVAKNDGSHEHAFAKTLEEQERNRQIYGNK